MAEVEGSERGKLTVSKRCDVRKGQTTVERELQKRRERGRAKGREVGERSTAWKHEVLERVEREEREGGDVLKVGRRERKNLE